jgi:pimeloyl-ACP methyl ester carboxylesterase
LTLPTLVITGKYDEVVPAKDAVELQKLIAGSHLEIIDQTTHLPQEEQPELFMEAVEKHWEHLVN